MRESKHRELRGTPDRGGDDRAEALLVAGLDHYFEGRYEEAIHLWTRVLFIDRGHARARAYINRARSALAERQRRADELMHAADEQLNRGAVEDARHTLAEAERLAGADDKAAELWARIDRTERVRRQPSPPGRSAAVVDARPVGRWRSRVRLGAQLLAAGAFGVLLATAAQSPVVSQWMEGRAGSDGAGAPPTRPLAVLSTSDVALVRARNFYRRGRLADALRALDEPAAVGVPESREIERLRIEIQNLLLTGHRLGGADPGPLP